LAAGAAKRRPARAVALGSWALAKAVPRNRTLGRAAVTGPAQVGAVGTHPLQAVVPGTQLASGVTAGTPPA
jgi:hypothetical protein